MKTKKNESGVVFVEASVVFPVMFLVIFLMIYAGNAYLQKARVEAIVTEIAIDGAAYCADPMSRDVEAGKIPSVSMKYSGEYFHEFAVTMPKVAEALKALEDAGILGGLEVDGGVLWCATEKVSKSELDRAVAIVKEVLA